MPLDACTLVLVTLTCLLLVAAVRWGITDADHPRTPLAPSDSLLVAGGHHLPRVPLHNRHRVHGRHRAR
ncbi:hypothetical protein ACIP5Y_43035 [Nocardia sp. NPDC088792]|uniref:hypothetical protein n=1 Tax=Nocardia sp. NPDC088792 TaxID=3364332 RepID=UPI00380BB846